MALRFFVIVCLISLSCCAFAAKNHVGDDDFNCVDIYKQPSLQHPLLKNHRIQMRPSLSLRNKLNRVTTDLKNPDSDLRRRLCPKGMVPIHKAKVDVTNIQPNSESQPGQHFATIETNSDGGIYEGAFALMSIENPSVQYNQYSKAQIWVENGSPSDLNSIQFGWAVHPRIYGDNLTRFTTYWTADGYKKTGCYNIICPGFVQLDHRSYPGMPYTNISSYGGLQFVNNHSLTHDPYTGNWLLMDRDVPVGYWPAEILTHLNGGATLVRYGGNTFTSPDGVSPPMGNGHYPVPDLGKSSFFAFMRYMNEKYEMIDISPKKMVKYVDRVECYGANYYGDGGPTLRQALTYGGAGGQECAI